MEIKPIIPLRVVREILWLAVCYNDHNFSPDLFMEKVMDIKEGLGIENIAQANDFLEKYIPKEPCIKELLDVLNEIQNMCIGEIAMGYKLDPEYIGNLISRATGMTHPDLADKLEADNEQD